MRRKPTRKDLLVVIARMQMLFGRIAAAASDTNPERAGDINRLTKAGEQDEPVDHRMGPWGDRND